MSRTAAYYPVFLDLQGRLCLVIGEGETADQKAQALTEAGAKVLRSPTFSPDINDVFLIVAVVEDKRIGRQIKEFAEKRRILVNVVDQTLHCTFIAPARMQRGYLTLAISTSGKSPALARKIREQLEEQFGPEYGNLVQALGEVRPLVKKHLSSFRERSEFYNQILKGHSLLEIAQREGVAATRACIEKSLRES